MENMIVINNRQYMGIDEAAKSLGVSVHHIRREMYRNNIRYFRHAKKILFLPEWLDEWVERHIVKPRPRK